MYFSLFKETKNFDFYCMFFSAVCVAQGYHITSKYHQIYTTFFNFKTILQVFSYHLYQPCDLTDSVSYQQQFSLNAYKQSWFLYSNAPAPARIPSRGT